MTKKGNNIIGILVIILAVCVVIGMVLIGTKKDQTSLGKYFNNVDKVVGSELYESLLNLSEANYPNTPEEIVKIYTNGYRLLYGDKIKDLSIVNTILKQQRLLFSDEILSKNTLEQQEKEVLKNIENLKQQKNKIIGITIEKGKIGEDNEAKVVVNVQDNILQEYTYTYLLKKDEQEKWKIFSFENISNFDK